MEQPEKPLSYWRSLGPIGGGIAVGLLVALQLRVHCAAQAQDVPMGPDIAFLLAPVLASLLFLIALALEVPLRWLASAPRSGQGAFVIGLSYAVVLCGWVFPDQPHVLLLLNPISLRFLARTGHSRRSRE